MSSNHIYLNDSVKFAIVVIATACLYTMYIVRALRRSFTDSPAQQNFCTSSEHGSSRAPTSRLPAGPGQRCPVI